MHKEKIYINSNRISAFTFIILKRVQSGSKISHEYFLRAR